ALARERVALEHLHHRTLRVGERDHIRDRGLGILPALGLDAVALDLALERTEIVLWPDLKSEADAFGLRAPTQHHRVMVDGRGQIDRVLVFPGHGQAEHVGVVFRLLVQVGHLVHGVGDLLDADHANLRYAYSA